MKKKRSMVKMNQSNIVFNNNFICISKSKHGTFFEIGNQITEDVAEAVSILMRKVSFDDTIWKTKLAENVIYDIIPEKSLYWLSGGQQEWDTLINYKKPWHESYIYFREEFEDDILISVAEAETLEDIRDYFYENLNLSRLYDYALKEDLIK
jgi:hypothetical protein